MMQYSAIFVSLSFLLVMFFFFIPFFLASSYPEKILQSYVDVNALYHDLPFTLSSNNGRPLLFLNKLGIIIVIAVDKVKNRKSDPVLHCWVVCAFPVNEIQVGGHDLFLCSNV